MGGCERGCRNFFLKLNAGCMVTKLKVLSFFRALTLEFFRTCARSQGYAAKNSYPVSLDSAGGGGRRAPAAIDWCTPCM